MVAKEFNLLYNTYDLLKTCTIGLIIKSPVEGLKVTIILCVT